MNKIKIGVVGAGVLGLYHIAKCRSNPSVSLCGFYDKDPARRQAAQEKCQARAYEDLPSIIAETDALIIATPSSTHREIARKCLDAQKHLLIEKPLATSYNEGVELVEQAHRAGVVLHVGHSEAFNAAFCKLMSFDPKPRFIEVHRLARFSPRGTDVSVVLDLMVHDIQLILRMCREEPDYGKIAATGVPVISNGIDIANARLVFPSGCVANITASRISAKRMRKIRIFAKDNYFSVDLDTGESDHYYLTAQRASPEGPPIAFDKVTVPPADALETELQVFIDAINGTIERNGVTGREALLVLKVTDVIMGLITTGTVS